VKVKVVVDTNFLLTMAQGVIAPSSLNDAINASYELVTTDAVVKELETMSKREDLLAREAGFALKLLERLGVQVLRVKAGSADESILTLAKELVQSGDRVVVATNDKNLRRSVRRLGVPIALSYYVYLSVGAWTWPIELSVDELKRILDGFSDEELAEYIAGEIDGDGMVWYNEDSRAVYVKITTCKNCPKRFILDVLKEVIAERFGIVENIDHFETVDALVFGGEKAVKLLRRIAKYIHHPLRRLRAELILAYYEGRIDDDKFEELYNIMKYELGGLDVKRNNALEALTRAAPQTHTHGI